MLESQKIKKGASVLMHPMVPRDMTPEVMGSCPIDTLVGDVFLSRDQEIVSQINCGGWIFDI
jgi:hypothetical protein